MDPRDHDLTGRTLGSQFAVTRKLGEGGMGQVYLARQLDMERDVVIKVMHPELTVGSPTAVERFKREARAVARLNHPHIVQVYVFGQTESGLLYLAMEYVEGRSLSDALEEAVRMPEPRALRIMDQVCSALAEAHGNGLVHRDLKPDNIMLSQRHGNPDYVKVLDFGIAKMIGPEDAKMTQTGSVFGTPQYMAPEQAKGLDVDARADLYAVGCILYEMLTGEHPFHADTAMGFLVQHMTEPVQPPTSRFPALRISPRTQALVMRLLEKEPTARFQSANELQHAIRTALQDHPASVRGYPTTPERGPLPGDGPTPAPPSGVAAPAGPPSPASAPWAPRGRSAWPWLAAALGALLLLGLGGGGAAYWALTRARAPETGADGPRRVAPPELPSPHGAGEEVPPAGEPIQGLPVPAGARLVSSTPQALTLTSDRDRDAILRFYEQQGRSWGSVTRHAEGLQFDGPETPVRFVSVSPMPGGFMIAMTLTGHAAVATRADVDSVFGAPLPPHAEEFMRTPDSAIFQVPGAPEPVLSFYGDRFRDDPDVTLVRTRTSDGVVMVINAEQAKRPYRTIALMPTPEGMRAGGPSTQITVVKAE